MLKCFNGIEYEFIEEKDGWISIYEIHEFTRERIPCIQAKDMAHAESWCVVRERPAVSFNIL